MLSFQNRVKIRAIESTFEPWCQLVLGALYVQGNHLSVGGCRPRQSNQLRGQGGLLTIPAKPHGSSFSLIPRISLAQEVRASDVFKNL